VFVVFDVDMRKMRKMRERGRKESRRGLYTLANLPDPPYLAFEKLLHPLSADEYGYSYRVTRKRIRASAGAGDFPMARYSVDKEV
jgi:hypothetical protein